MKQCSINISQSLESKQIRELSANDLKEIGITNIIDIPYTPITIINGTTHIRRAYRFDTLEDVQQWFRKDSELYLVMASLKSSNGVFGNTSLYGNIIKGDTVKVEKPDPVYESDHVVGYAPCNCKLVCCCSSLHECVAKGFIVHILEPASAKELDSDAFKECDSIQCVIDTVADTLQTVLTGE